MLMLASLEVGGCDDDNDELPGAGASASGTAGSTAAAGGRGDASGAGGSSSGGDAGRSGEDAGRGAGGNGDAGEVGQGGRSMGTAGTSLAGAPEGGETNEAGAAGAGGREPNASGPRDIEHTELDVDLDTHEATATIRLGPSEIPGVLFEIGDLLIRSVELDGAALDYTDSDGKLNVDVPAGSEPVTIAVSYDFGDHPNFDGYSPAGYTYTWPYFCGNLFPCRSAPANGTTFGLEVTGGSGTLIYPTAIPSAAPSYMAAWVHGNYTEVALGTTSAGTEVSVYYLADVPNAATDVALGTARLVDGFDWYETHLGPYAFGTKVATVAVDWPGGVGGMEHHPFWHMGIASMLDPLLHLHEASHGWFGNGVRLRCWQDFILSEGTASYLAAHVLEALGETEIANAEWARFTANAAAGAPNDDVIPWPDGCDAFDINTSNLYSSAVYAKGALFYRSLEQRIGAAALEDAFRDFYAAWAGKAARFQDLLDTVQASSGYDARPCAVAWLKTTPAPTPGPCE